MKRTLAILLCLLLLCGLFAGCEQPAAPGESGPKTDTGASPASTQAAPASTDAPPATEEYSLEREPGTRQLRFYWKNEKADLSKCDMWIWYPEAEGRGYLFHPWEYGGMVALNVPEEISEVGFIVRKNCSDPGGTSWGDATKDYEEDRYAVLTGEETEIYLLPGEAGQYTSTDGGKTLSQNKQFSLAGIVDLNQIQYFISPATRFESLDQIKVLEGDREIPVESLSSLNNQVITGTITLAEELDFSKTYTVVLEGFEPQNAVPTKVFDSQAFARRYTYEGDDLGAVIDGAETCFKLWAPTASAVVLNLFESGDGGEAYEHVALTRGEQGVWSARVPCGHGTYYTYSVTTSLGTQEAVDPYARTVGVNGNRGMVVDLSATDPEGFGEDQYFAKLEAYNEAVIWEVHVRDFSNRIADSRWPGKYLAFTETGLTNAAGEAVGVDYLKDLGITHVHFQPIYDYATVDESRLEEAQFNWGYDPKNYNAPEGSYSTDPYHGEVRITELKQMVQALHRAGMGVVMDVVYNHTYDLDSCLNRVVPYYYYRYTGTGAPSNGSGCGNETASERSMFRKYMVDSVSYWAKEYHIDGFRFDLMALHDVETMQAIEAAVHEINPKAILYGEGWTGGTTTLNPNLQANQANISQISPSGEGIGAVAVFNDAIRDGLKGSVFDAKDRGYINGNANAGTAAKVIFGLLGGQGSNAVSWSVADNAVINYMACHDNNTIWDKLLASNPEASEEERFAMNRLGEEILFLGKGVPFMLAGEELLRTKQGDHNSYKSSDEINNLDWESLRPDSDVCRMRDLMRELIALRRNNLFLTRAEPTCELLENNVIRMVWTLEGKTVAAALINPNDQPVPAALPEGDWLPLFTGEGSDETTVGAKDVLVAAAR